MTKAQQSEQNEARETLRAMLPPGSTVYTVLRHVSRSGMSRRIDLYTIQDNEPRWISGYAKTALGYPRTKFDAITVGGCGMDMGFHLVSNLSRVLYPQGFGCTGREHGNRCPSNDHSNGDRDYTEHMQPRGCQNPVCYCHDATAPLSNLCSSCGCEPAAHWHNSGDYALRQVWM